MLCRWHKEERTVRQGSCGKQGGLTMNYKTGCQKEAGVKIQLNRCKN